MNLSERFLYLRTDSSGDFDQMDILGKRILFYPKRTTRDFVGITSIQLEHLLNAFVLLFSAPILTQPHAAALLFLRL